MFDLAMANRLELAAHMPEDLVIAEHLRPSAPGRILDALEALRVAGLSTYENRRVSTGVLLLGEEDGAGASGRGDGPRTMRFDVRLTAIRSFLRLCDGLHTLFLVDGSGGLAGLVASALAGVECAEYAPAMVKQAVCGYGRAEKVQVQRMVRAILGLDELPNSTHEADALAVAICHALAPPLLRVAS
jgi:hypothetical protein